MPTLQLFVAILSTLMGIYFLLTGLGKIRSTKTEAPKKNSFYAILGGVLIVLSMIRLYSAYLQIQS